VLNFPSSPAVNAVYAAGGHSWTWDGVKWQPTTGATGTVSTITVNGSVTLPTGKEITVNINNTTGGPITLTLPSPTLPDQTYKFKDVAGNAGTYPITIAATAAYIDNASSYLLLSNYMSIELYWTGALWGTR
jgi:hypothetical protein